MGLDKTASPHRRSPASTLRKRDELGSLSTVLERHRFLLTALALLALLCAVYLYFAVILGAKSSDASCSELSGTEKALCKLELAKSSANGKMKFV